VSIAHCGAAPDSGDDAILRRVMHLLALCGSLRAASINAAMLRAFARLAPAGIELRLFPTLGALPLFSPDLEADRPPAVRALHAAVAAADGLVIASPEYAHGVSGTMKNALDWLVSFEPFIHKPTAVVNASPRAHHADDALRETLRTMSAGLVGEASFELPLLGAQWDEDAMAASADVAAVFAQVVAALRAEHERQRAADVPVFPLR
jgi:chromate reductase